MTDAAIHVGGPAELLVGGLAFPEEPRWRADLLWFIDAGANQILAVDEEGREMRRIALDFTPGGLGWLPDETLLVVDVQGRRVVAIAAQGASSSTYADVSRLARLRPNGLCVSRDGVAYVATIGSELRAEEPRPSGNIIQVAPDLRQEVLFEDDIRFPNGISLSLDERRLYVPETFGERVSIFELATGARVVAPVSGTWPDGSCAASADSLWFADAGSARIFRVDHGGRIVETQEFCRRCYAPAMNGRRDRLYAAVADDHGAAARARRTGSIFWKPIPT
ncbi:SMP-30/gluconolactonase/LRE family protein [Phenylobacterium sp.]|uniref:SMP-30/gluconolactonase/LRE family protein n=1 Tax=Phenylobacterium sp. TaxID=1871053 RepID=UPI0035B37E83